MNKVITTLAIVMSLFLVSCQNNGNDPVIENSCIGSWQGGIGGEQLMGLLPRDILIDVKINNDKDSTYSLIATYEGIDTSMKHLGSWHLNSTGDSIILVGNDCQVIDTTQNKMVTRECGPPIPIYINIQNNAWKVWMTDLLPVAETLQINLTGSLAEYAKKFEITLLKQK